nr:hypothetical protein [Caballeronia sp. SEWSISQ10-4 2]
MPIASKQIPAGLELKLPQCASKTEAEIIETYFGRVDSQIGARVTVYKALADLKRAPWSMVQNEMSTLDFDYFKFELPLALPTGALLVCISGPGDQYFGLCERNHSRRTALSSTRRTRGSVCMPHVLYAHSAPHYSSGCNKTGVKQLFKNPVALLDLLRRHVRGERHPEGPACHPGG